MASAPSHSFRYLLLSRILLLLMPMLGLSEALVYQQARRSLLHNAQQQVQEMAQARAATLEVRQLELQLESPEICPPEGCPTAEAIIQRSFDSLFPTPVQSPRSSDPAPLVLLLGPDHTRLAQSGPSCTPSPISSPGQPNPPPPQSKSNAAACAFIRALDQGEISLSAGAAIQSEDWIVASQPTRLAPLSRLTLAESQVAALGQIVVALPRDQITAPLRPLSRWMVGATLLLFAVSLGVALYLSRQLARPAELLRDRLLLVQQQLSDKGQAGTMQSLPPTPQPSAVREFQQLTIACDQLIRCLNERTAELEVATREAHSASKLKSDFLAATSHELRTPLNAMIGHIHLIQDGLCDCPEEEALCLEQANQAALHLLKVLNELLDIARIEAGQFVLAQQRLDLRCLVTEVLELQGSSLRQKSLQLNLGPMAEPQWVDVDRDKFKQVLLNLLSNAIKFTDRGSITVTFHSLSAPPAGGLAAQAPASQRWISLRITDTGIGIEREQQPQLFEPFVRASTAAGERQYEGTGLGLAISRTLMEHMGGHIRLYSAGLGQGTTAELLLPRQEPAPCSTDDATKDSTSSSADGSNVDDSTDGSTRGSADQPVALEVTAD